MGRCARLNTCARRARNSRNVYLAIQLTRSRQRQQCQLDSRSETTGVSNSRRGARTLAIDLGQTIDIALRLIAEVLRQIDNLQALGHLVLLPELAALAVRRTHKQHIDSLQVVLGTETQIGFAPQTAVNIAHVVACIARRMNKCDLHLRMVDQQSEQLACGITRAAYNSDLNHYFSLRF